jgi:hypothetical protein
MGRPSWWCEGDEIPATHTDVRPATPLEAALMDEIIQSPGMPSLDLGKRIGRLMSPPAGFHEVVAYLQQAGLQLVPVQPTRAMWDAGAASVADMPAGLLPRLWRAMLAAAPGAN